jgi:HK97 family phage major capsid protein
MEKLMAELKELKADIAASNEKTREQHDKELKEFGELTTKTLEQVNELKAKAKQLEELQAEYDEMKNRVTELENAKQRPGSGDDDERKPFKGVNYIGEFLQAVAKSASGRSGIDPRLHQITGKAATGLGEGVPSDGGFLVQMDMAGELLRRTYETGVLASRVRRIPISANANGLRINAINETSRACGSRYGGLQLYWLDEAGTKTASKPEFRQMELNLKKLTGLVYATDELLQDAAALQSLLMQVFPEEFAFVVDHSILHGTGAGQPLGVLNSGARVTVAKEVGQGATIMFENIVNMWSRMWSRSRANAIWLINQDIEPQLMSMSLSVGTGGVPVYMPAGGLSGQPYATLMGRPVIAHESTQTLGTEGDIILIDPSQYLMIDKGGLQQASSIHVQFIYDETVFRFVMRLDGQPTWNAALTPRTGSANTLSPYVTLAARP